MAARTPMGLGPAVRLTNTHFTMPAGSPGRRGPGLTLPTPSIRIPTTGVAACAHRPADGLRPNRRLDRRPARRECRYRPAGTGDRPHPPAAAGGRTAGGLH